MGKIVHDGKIDLMALVEALSCCEPVVREDENATNIADARGMLNKGYSAIGLGFAREYLHNLAEELTESELCANAGHKLDKVLKAEKDGLHDEAGCKQLVSILLAELGMLQDKEVEDTIDELLELQQSRKELNTYAFELFTEGEPS